MRYIAPPSWRGSSLAALLHPALPLRDVFGLEQKVVQPPGRGLAAGALLGGGAHAHVDVGAAGGADGPAGVLVEHELVERLGVAARRRDARLHQRHAAAREELLVGREAP